MSFKNLRKYFITALIYLFLFDIFPLVYSVMPDYSEETLARGLLNFVYPAVIIVSGIKYAKKFGFDWIFVLLAPLFFAPSVFIFYSDVSRASLYLLIYLFAGIVGLGIPDLFSKDESDSEHEENSKKHIRGNDDQSNGIDDEFYK